MTSIDFTAYKARIDNLTAIRANIENVSFNNVVANELSVHTTATLPAATYITGEGGNTVTHTIIAARDNAIATSEAYTDNAIANIPPSVSLIPKDQVIPWNRFNYFRLEYNNVFWMTTSTQNGPAWNNQGPDWLVTASVVLPFSGLHRITVPVGNGQDCPILRVQMNTSPTPVDQSIDLYSDQNPTIAGSFAWEFTANAGTYTMTLSTPTKNGDSGGYYLAGCAQGISISYMG
jgi:hypothetical protein